MIKEATLLLKLSVVFCVISLVCVSCRKADLSTKESIRQLPSIEQKFFNTHKSLEPKINAIAEYVKRLNDEKNIVELTVQRIGYPRWDKAFKLSSTSNSVAIKSTSRGTSNGATTPAQNYDIYSIPFVRDSQNYVNASMIVRTSPSDTSISYICDWQYRNKPHGSGSSNTTAESHAMFFMMMGNRVFGHKEFDIIDPNLFPGKTKEPGKKRINIVNKKSGSGLPIKSQDLVLTEICNEYYICTSPDYCNAYGGCDYLSCGTYCYPVATICWLSWSGGGGGTGWGLPGSGSGDNGAGGGTGGNTPPPGSELPPVPCDGPPSQASIPGSTIQIKLQNEPCSSSLGWTTYYERSSYDNTYSGDEDNNESGGYDNTTYSDFDQTTQQWPTVANVIPLTDFVGWGASGVSPPNCMSYAKAQIAKKGFKISNYGDPGQTIQIYTAANGVNPNASKNGVGYLLSALQRGVPVIVGVDDQNGSSNPQTDNTTDHFIVIVGSGSDSNGMFFTFYDNASGDPVKGTNPNNKLYYDPATGLIKGRSQTNYAAPLRDYVVTMIRKSK